jgi:uncharacterized protein Smg (DUF494 family)
MNRQQAQIIVAILDSIQGNWQDIADALDERGLDLQEIINAWKALEKLAGMRGTAPQLSDFQ